MIPSKPAIAPTEEMRTRMLGLPVSCKTCKLYYSFSFTPWCQLHKESPRMRLNLNLQFDMRPTYCSDFKLLPPGEHQLANPPRQEDLGEP